jgi:hypothetical protein
MDKVQKPCNSKCYTPSSELFRVYMNPCVLNRAPGEILSNCALLNKRSSVFIEFLFKRLLFTLVQTKDYMSISYFLEWSYWKSKYFYNTRYKDIMLEWTCLFSGEDNKFLSLTCLRSHASKNTDGKNPIGVYILLQTMEHFIYLMVIAFE